MSCRNVLIYFDRALQDRALGLFRDSLCRQGFLGLGSKESLRFSVHGDGLRRRSCARSGSSRRAGGMSDPSNLRRRRSRRGRHRRLGGRRRGAVRHCCRRCRRSRARRCSSSCTCRATRPACWPSIFARKCALPVREAEDKEPVAPGTVYFAPPNYHLLIDDGPQLALSADEPVHIRGRRSTCCSSRRPRYHGRLLGIILTGANEDGAPGSRRFTTWPPPANSLDRR